MPKLILHFTVVLSLTGSPLLSGENWPQWRGPNQNNLVPGTGFPTEWAEDKGIVWKIKLPGWRTSTPAIWGEQIFVTSEDEGNNVLISLNRDGKKQWQVVFGPSAGNRNQKASGSNPSPVTDGTQVYAYYRSGDLACVDFQGNVVWQTETSRIRIRHGSRMT